MAMSGYEQLADLFDQHGDDRRDTRIGTVTNVDGEGTVWVRFDGNGSDTPVHACMASVRTGDSVPVRIRGGCAEIVANASDVPASTSGVSDVSERAYAAMQSAVAASAAASDAQATAEAVHGLAEQAQVDADIASRAASTALEEARTATAAAGVAEGKALEATEAARSANIHLSEVEQVVGTLNWIEDHGSYVSQAGQAFDPEKTYYLPVYTYAPTSDTEIVEGKTYYTRTGSGTDEDPYVYAPVEEPDAGDLPTYYEVTSTAYRGVSDPVPEDIDSYYILVVDESVRNYLASHLSQTDYGLNIMFDGATEYIHIGTVDGTYPEGVYMLVAGGIRSSYTESGITVGPASGFHVVMTGTALNFYQGAALVAWVNNNELNIPSAVIEKSIKLGDWMFQMRPSGNMGLFYVG